MNESQFLLSGRISPLRQREYRPRPRPITADTVMSLQLACSRPYMRLDRMHFDKALLEALHFQHKNVQMCD